jgi:hypothetical protein
VDAAHTEREEMTFEEWLAAVDRDLMKLCKLTHRDLADYNYRDAFEDELTPLEAAWEVLVEEGFGVS